MNTSLRIFASLLALFIALPASAQKEVKELPRLLVMPLRPGKGLQEPAAALDTLLLQAVHAVGRYRVLGKGDVEAMLGAEEMKQMMGCDDVSCMVQIGGALGARYLVSGELKPFGTQSVLSLNLIDNNKTEVISRATATGGMTPDELTKMMKATVEKCFGAAATRPIRPSGSSPTSTPDYSAFQAMATKLGSRMTRSEYTAMLEDIAAYEKQQIAAPPGQNIGEYLWYYRAMACMQLKRRDCVNKAAAIVKKRWPNGLYTEPLTDLADRLNQEAEDQALDREDAQEELKERIAEIDEQEKKGIHDAITAMELRGYAFLSAKMYKKAAKHLGMAIKKHEDPQKKMQVAQSFGVAMEQLARFAEYRTILEKLQKLDKRAFRKAGLHHTLRRLPK